jgi:topoisomerase-4 subunit A
MAYVKDLFNVNFLEYASYVIKDRAIPHIADGLKPVQRRILHSLHEMDDGKFNKVANVVGHCMRYHPHGDQSIISALVVLANKDLFIEKQGNFGNIFTGDEASAARYIECRLTPLAREVLFNPDITEYAPSYDSRNKEPVALPAKVPVLLALGTEGIAPQPYRTHASRDQGPAQTVVQALPGSAHGRTDGDLRIQRRQRQGARARQARH